jgi:hypothetical protein
MPEPTANGSLPRQIGMCDSAHQSDRAFGRSRAEIDTDAFLERVKTIRRAQVP